ncbi:hypothetical protein Hanom_Chr12g01159621 [Helianthus anomalus]
MTKSRQPVLAIYRPPLWPCFLAIITPPPPPPPFISCPWYTHTTPWFLPATRRRERDRGSRRKTRERDAWERKW